MVIWPQLRVVGAKKLGVLTLRHSELSWTGNILITDDLRVHRVICHLGSPKIDNSEPVFHIQPFTI